MDTQRTAATVALAATLLACNADDVPDGVLTLDPGPVALAGLWTGIEEITGTDDGASGIGGGAVEGIRFPVSLVLRLDRTFTLRTVGFQVSAGADDRSCDGVYRAEARVVEFFPDAACRALPLSQYAVGRFLPDGLSLEASTGPGGAGAVFDGIGVRVRIEVERD